jgi:hypothetical protein
LLAAFRSRNPSECGGFILDSSQILTRSFSLCRRDLLDISPVLTEAAGAIVDVSCLCFFLTSYAVDIERSSVLPPHSSLPRATWRNLHHSFTMSFFQFGMLPICRNLLWFNNTSAHGFCY